MLQSINQWITAEKLPDSYITLVDQYWRPLLKQLRARQERLRRPLLVAVNGAQGTGKSTLSQCLQALLEIEHGSASAVISIDDIYYGRSYREALAQDIHPLLSTRGVPGTHDTGLGIAVLEALLQSKPVQLPRFDKANDDRFEEADWPWQKQAVDFVFFEGWCVSSTPQTEADLDAAVNKLEADEDSNCAWRSYVNQQLTGNYQTLFAMLDCLIMLKAPSMDAVYEWRCLQEEKLAARAGDQATALMSRDQIARFIQHYERLTRHNLKEMPDRADFVFELDADHNIAAARDRHGVFS